MKCRECEKRIVKKERVNRLDDIRYEIEHFNEIEEQMQASNSEPYDWLDIDEKPPIHELIKFFCRMVVCLRMNSMKMDQYQESLIIYLLQRIIVIRELIV